MRRVLPAGTVWFLLSLLFLAFAASPAYAAGLGLVSLTPAQVGTLDAAIHAEMQRQQVWGYAVAVVLNGRVALAKNYGHEDFEARRPLAEVSLFRLASLSKPVTALLAMQMHAQGKFDLDRDIRYYVPEFPDKGVVITPRHLLSHQGGIVHYATNTVAQPAVMPASFRDPVAALDTFKDAALLNEPGAAYNYSSYGYILLSAALQRAGGAPFAELVRNYIAQPLGINSLQPDDSRVTVPGRVQTGYVLQGGAVQPSKNEDVSWKLAAGGYIATIQDMGRLAAVLINRQLLPAASYDQMWNPQRDSFGRNTDMALGFFVQKDKNGQVERVSHNGAQDRAKARMVLYPAQGHGIVVMTNAEHAEPGKMTTAIYKALRGLTR